MYETNKLIKLLPYIPAFLITVSCLQLIYFYSAFHINIVEYLEFTEVIILCIDKVIFYTAFFFLPFMILFFIIGRSIYKSNDKILLESVNLSRSQRIKKDFKENWLIIIGVVVSDIFSIYVGVDLVLLFICNINSLFFFLRREIFISYKMYYDKYIDTTYLNLSGLLFAFIYYIIITTSTKIRDVKRPEFLGTTVRTETERIVSDSTKFYIGKTKGYIFFYNKKNYSTTILPMSTVKEIVIRHNIEEIK